MVVPQSELDALWDFSDPSGSEARLRAAAGTETDAATRAELATQVARALGLQERFAEGRAELDAVASDAPVVGVRIALERGRLRNSGGDAEGAVAFFEDAARKAASVGQTFLQVDALHMIAIAAPDRAADATTEALAVLDRVDDPRTLRWRVALHNNAGWTHFDAGRFAEAITAFQHARDAAERWGTPSRCSGPTRRPSRPGPNWADSGVDTGRIPLRGLDPTRALIWSHSARLYVQRTEEEFGA